MAIRLRPPITKSAISAALGLYFENKKASDPGRPGRITVQITRCSTSLLDADNLGGSVKFVLDALRRANLIPDDDPASIDLQVSQVKVARRKEIGTHVRIIRA